MYFIAPVLCVFQIQFDNVTFMRHHRFSAYIHMPALLLSFDIIPVDFQHQYLRYNKAFWPMAYFLQLAHYALLQCLLTFVQDDFNYTQILFVLPCKF